METYIRIKQVGKRKCSIEKMSAGFPTPPASAQELIKAVVYRQVRKYNEWLQQGEMLKCLICEEIEDKATTSKVDSKASYNDESAAETEAIINALQSCGGRIPRIFLDDAELGELSSPAQLREESAFASIQLTVLSGGLR